MFDDDVAADTPETEAVVLDESAPVEVISDHAPSVFAEAWDAMIVPAVEVADFETRATIRLSAIEPVDVVAVYPTT
jgi:hypothetical protein